MADPVTMAFVGLAAATASTVGGIVSASKASKAQEKAYEAQKKQAAVENARAANANYAQQLQNIRRGRIARATALASGISAGAEEGSAVQGAIGSVGSQTAYNVSTLATDIGLAQQSAAYGSQAAGYLSQANQYGTYGSIFNAVGSLGASIFSSAGGFNTFGANTQKLPEIKVTG